MAADRDRNAASPGLRGDSAVGPVDGATRALHAYCDASFAKLLAASPEVATELGLVDIADKRLPHDGWSDLSPAGDARRRLLMEQTLRGLGDFTPTEWQASLDRDVFEFFLRWGNFGRLRGTEAASYPLCDYVADHLTGAQTEVISCLLDWQPLNDALDANAWLERLESVPRHIATLIDALEHRRSAGNVMPGCVVERVLSELDILLATPIERSALLTRYREARPRDASERVVAALERGLYPAYARLRDKLQSDYPHEDRLGLWRLRDGEGWYAFLLKAHTTTDLTVREVRELGVSELTRQQSELRGRLNREGFSGETLRAQFAAFDLDPRVRRSPDPTREQLLSGINAITRQAEQQLLPLFGIRPRASLKVRAVPETQEGNRHTAYVPPAPDGSRTGAFEVNLRQLQDSCRYDDFTLVYHEAMPGHHVQLTVAQERERAPAFRRALVHDGYIEGWAKYAETLPALEGINSDPLWDLARRRSELYSTANLVLDTSIHAHRWVRDQGVQFFAENTGCTHEFAAAIVDRVTARPAQACAYKLGMNAITEARQRMARALGSQFDLPRFHDFVLEQGSLPLTVFERRVADAARVATVGVSTPGNLKT